MFTLELFYDYTVLGSIHSCAWRFHCSKIFLNLQLWSPTVQYEELIFLLLFPYPFLFPDRFSARFMSCKLFTYQNGRRGLTWGFPQYPCCATAFIEIVALCGFFGCCCCFGVFFFVLVLFVCFVLGVFLGHFESLQKVHFQCFENE